MDYQTKYSALLQRLSEFHHRYNKPLEDNRKRTADNLNKREQVCIDNATGEIWMYIPETIEEYQLFKDNIMNIYEECNEIKWHGGENPYNPFLMMKDMSLVEETIIATMILDFINDVVCMDYSYVDICDEKFTVEDLEESQEARRQWIIKDRLEDERVLSESERILNERKQLFMDKFLNVGIKNALCYIVGCSPDALLDKKLLYPEWIRDFAQ
jgi:hypothetical protein